LRKSSAETLLAQFTPPEHAVSIVGDIAELSLTRRRGWFTREVIWTAASFWFQRARAAPLRAFKHAFIGLALYNGVYVVLFVASGLPWFPWHRVHELGFSGRLWAVTFISNLLTGAILARRLSPWRADAIASLLFLWIAVSVIWPPFALRLYPWAWWPTALHMPWRFLVAASLAPILYVAPLTIGVLAARKLGTAQPTHF
jgi:hypothetical protein